MKNFFFKFILVGVLFSSYSLVEEAKAQICPNCGQYDYCNTSNRTESGIFQECLSEYDASGNKTQVTACCSGPYSNTNAPGITSKCAACCSNSCITGILDPS